MALRWMPLVLGALQAAAAPALLVPDAAATSLHDLDAGAGDTASVGSYIREVRAAAPEGYHKSYTDEGDGEIGYSRKKEGGGKKGYQHFDSYHKAAGDHYEFEKADAFGHDGEAEAGAHSQPHETRERAPLRQRQQQRGRGSGSGGRNKRQPEIEEEESSASAEGEAEAEGEYGRYEEGPSSEEHHHQQPNKKKKNKRPQEDEHGPHYEELKEGASDGNGGVEAIGHDPDDYKLPEKYTWEPEEF